MRTGKQYVEDLCKMRRNLYMKGQRVSRDDARFEPILNTLSLTFDLVSDPQWEPYLTATSHITGQKVNRFCHVHQNVDDLTRRRKLTRDFTINYGICIQRCGAADSLCALSIVTHDVDQARGTEYYQRFLNYLKYFQERDLTAPIAVSDPKGDRMLRPHLQADPDLYLRVVEKKSDGIVVRGAKFHADFGSHADELIVAPNRVVTKEEADWAVAFAVPADAEGVRMVCQAGGRNPRQKLEAPYTRYGWSLPHIIFDNVFVPWERVFMCGEWEFAGDIGRYSAFYHRYNYTACRPALLDLLIGMAGLAAEYNGIERASHVQAKIAELISVRELVDAAGVAATFMARKSGSGTMIPDELYVNASRYHAGVNHFHTYETVCDIAGGLAITLPYEEDFLNPEIGPYLDKYLKRKAGIPSENIHRLFRYVQDMIAGPSIGRELVGNIHGAGSPIMERIAMMRLFDLEARKNIVKRLAGIES